MTERLLGAASWLALLGGTVAVVAAATADVAGHAPAVVPAPAALATSPAYPADRDSLLLVIVARNPFRAERRPSSIPYRPDAGGGEDDDAPAKPRLRLVGLVTGGGVRALIDGIPGREGARLLAVGDTASGLRLAAVGPRSARVTGMDTTWLLVLERQP